MSYRINLRITNKTNERIKCAHILCKDIDTLDVGTVIEPNASDMYHATTSDRVFCEFTGLESGTSYKLAMTCPKSSRNSACGYGSAGLQHYERGGTPVTFTFNIGTKDLADWENGDVYDGEEVTYKDC